MIFVSQSDDGGKIVYEDKKRYLWFLSVFSPAIPAVFSIILLLGGAHYWAVAPVIIYYGIIPALDLLFGEDHTNPPEEVVEELSNDNFYRALLYCAIPVSYFSVIICAYVVGTLSLPLWAVIALAVSAGVVSGSALTIGHELGHKHSKSDRIAAKIICALSGYSHFCIEHNQGHHVMVATPEDPTSARWNESLYAFALRELPATAMIAWEMERKRLEKRDHSFWNWRNDILQGYAIHLVMVATLIALYGWIMVLFFLIHWPVSWLQLTMANYVEHYGLLRGKTKNGKYEPCQPIHSWNTNHIVSNLLLFHLQRHSDHHANPLRPYQSLRNFDELPRLPSGYPGSFALAVIPPLWFRIMNPKVLEWTGGDMSKINTG